MLVFIFSLKVKLKAPGILGIKYNTNKKIKKKINYFGSHGVFIINCKTKTSPVLKV
jgi:hypothetical protein